MTPRARELGLVPVPGVCGPQNAITDVPGVAVGHTTVRVPPDVHTGVTAIVPSGIGPRAPLPAGLFAGNGYGKLIGSTQVTELGVIESPVVLTATLSAFRAADALVTWMLAQPENDGVVSFNPLVGECNDGFLSDIRARPVTEDHVLAAIAGATGGPVEEGSVGAGTGTAALGFKAGIGTSSRVVDLGGEPVTVGVLVQANFGGTLRAAGIPAGGAEPARPREPDPDAGSCMIVAATDAALDARQLTRLARRLVFALARVGASYGNGSGDYGIAFGTTPTGTAPARTTPTGTAPARPVPDAALNPLFTAAMDAVEESVLNSLTAAGTTTGVDGNTARGIPMDRPRPRMIG